MSRGIRRQAPALIVAAVALVAALGGTVYAAGKINGRAIKAKSLPGNRLALASVPGNRLKAGTITGDKLAPGTITGSQIDAATLGQVSSAVYADAAGSAGSAKTAETAAQAANATTVNGYEAGCAAGTTRPFAGACWQTAASGTALSAPDAAAACADQGGELPAALALAAFSKEPGITLAIGDEWSGDIPSYTSLDAYSLITVSSDAKIGAAVSTTTKKFRCVLPLVG
jgi:hypothetical protein